MRHARMDDRPPKLSEPPSPNAAATDISRPVAYVTDRWLLDRAPWAMWTCVVGIAVLLHAPTSGTDGVVLSLAYLAALGLAFAGWAATTLLERRLSFLPALATGLALFVLVAAIIALATGRPGRWGPNRRSLWANLVDPPIDVFGWMLLYLGAAYIVFAIFRHRHPGRPVLTASPAGITLHRTWLRNVFIGWRDIRAVGPFDRSSPGAPSLPNPKSIAILVPNEIYEHRITPKIGMLAPPGHQAMFWPKNGMMQVVLTSVDVTATPEEYRVPIEARWRAFRNLPESARPADGTPTGDVVTYGRWSFGGSPLQTTMFLAPLLALAAIVLHAALAG